MGLFQRLIRLNQDFENKEEVILRDFLALERTRLANERTLLAYIRSSLYLVLGGIAFLQLNDFVNIRWLGYVALVLSIFFIIIGISRFVQLNRSLRKHYYANKLKQEVLQQEKNERADQ